jgi:hypothetical protein
MGAIKEAVAQRHASIKWEGERNEFASRYGFVINREFDTLWQKFIKRVEGNKDSPLAVALQKAMTEQIPLYLTMTGYCRAENGEIYINVDASDQQIIDFLLEDSHNQK